MSRTSAISAEAERAAHEAAPWIARLARLGFLAHALLYITVGALATSAALRLLGTRAPVPSKTVGSRGAMAELLQAPAGHVLLYVLAVGLAGYGIWRAIAAIIDPEHHGHDAKGIVHRLGSAGVAIIHFGLAYSAVRIAMGHLGAAHEGTEERHWTARALATPGGAYVLFAIALGLAAYGVYEIYCAARAKLGEGLTLSMSSRARRWVLGISRFGIAARAIVFVVTGGLVAAAVHERNPEKAPGPGRSLRELFELGTIPFLIVAVGLIAFGVYQLLNAKYRQIRVA
ncbi:MAG TPA: DUF1206 domain-containing protein [Kofleriaceae bacterium]|nr:DUF1206 domain-containing protein [Kofleriaceae bacterium]